MNCRLYNNQSFVETAIYRVFVLNLDNKVDLQSFSEEEIQTYYQFLMEVLQATADSSGNSQVVYPLLAKNTDKLDGVLAEILRRWGTNRLDFLWCNSNHLRVLTSKYK
ncbi:MAG: hypothetical protein V7K20_15750 [Nostoc sp.]